MCLVASICVYVYLYIIIYVYYIYVCQQNRLFSALPYSNNGDMIRYSQLPVQYTHTVTVLTIIFETAKISFKLQTNASNFYTTNCQPF